MIVAIDGASTDLSVALADHDGAVLAVAAWTSEQRQSAELLPRLLDLLAANGRRIDEATAVAIGTGPGSFTGLRVAMALGKGLAFALGCPIVGVPSLTAWLEADPEAAAALARAGAREAYLVARDDPTPRIVDRDRLADLDPGTALVAPAELARAFELPSTRPPRAAGAIAARASAVLRERPDGHDLATLEPIYLRAPRGVTTEAEAEVKWL